MLDWVRFIRNNLLICMWWRILCKWTGLYSLFIFMRYLWDNSLKLCDLYISKAFIRCNLRWFLPFRIHINRNIMCWRRFNNNFIRNFDLFPLHYSCNSIILRLTWRKVKRHVKLTLFKLHSLIRNWRMDFFDCLMGSSDWHNGIRNINNNIRKMRITQLN